MKLTLIVTACLLLAAPLAEAQGMTDSYQNLREAVTAKKSAEAIKPLAVETIDLAKQAVAEKEPQDAAEKPEWTKRIAYAKEVQSYAEYALFAAAIQSPPATLIDLISTLEAHSPKSKYLDEAYSNYFAALNQTGASAKIQAIAEKAITNLPDNEDLLLVVMDAALNRKQADRAGAYAERLIAAVSKHGKPESLSAADWEKKKALSLGRAYWVAGLVHSEKQQWYLANQDLRAALPYIQGNNAMLGPALFQLGLANYNLGKISYTRAQILEAAEFSKKASAIPGPHQQQAWTNANIMQREADAMIARKK